VAIIVPLSQQAVEGKGRPISKIVLQNIKVLGWQEIEYMENPREPRSVSSVTLQVKPEQAEKLVLAANKGRLQVVMHKYGEQ
jgi:pilus assembly protein CpaB